MLDRYYLRRLGRDVDRWAARGWLDPRHREAILADAAAGRGGPVRPASGVFAVLGAVLLAIGVILFVAANWSEMPRAARLAVVFGGLWTTHGLALFADRRGWDRFAEAFVLLATLVFGAAIMLVAQIFHLPADPPGGVLLWALGVLGAAWLWPSALAAGLGLLLTLLWSHLWLADAPGYPLHLPFLVLWAAFLPPVWRHRWRAAVHVALLALAGWVALTIGWITVEVDERLFGDLLRLAAAGAVALLTLGAVLEARARLDLFARPLQRHWAVWLAVWLFPLTIPAIQAEAGAFRERPWPVLTLALLAAAAVPAAWLWRRGGDRLPLAAVGLAAAAVVVAGANRPALAAVALALIWIAALIGAVAEGYRRRDGFVVNVGFATLAVTLLWHYFDTFWALLDRSVFFMGGGAVAFGVGWIFERQRRRQVGGMGGAE